MHESAYSFVERTLADLPPRRSVVEIGSRWVNGGITGLLNGAAYTGLDLYPGEGVDVVADALTWAPPAPVDTVICCEVLEHAAEPAALCRAAYDWLAPGGVLILTAASPERPPHSGIDGGSLREGESYRGVTEADLAAWLAPFGGGFGIVRDPHAGDIYAVAAKPGVPPPADSPPLKLLIVRSGADFSVKDVEDGMTAGLRAAGHEVREYDLFVRLSRSRSWLDMNYRRARRSHPDIRKPDLTDWCYQAGKDIVIDTLRHVPDWVIVVTGVLLHPAIPLLLKRAGAPLAFLLTESPYMDEEQADIVRLADLVWTNERASLGQLRHCNARYLPHAYNPGQHTPEGDGDDVPAHDVVFVGTGFRERVEVLAGADWSGIDLGLYGSDWTELGSRHPLRRFLRGGKIDNARAAALYRRAHIGLNLYRASAQPAESLNPRAYELAACGAFHLSEYRAEVPEVFGNLVPTFKGGGELESAVRHWLPKETERAALGRCLTEAVAGHTWPDRARQIARDLRDTTPALPEKIAAGVAG